MKSDLDRLMSERGFDAFIVTGATVGNPVMYYMTNGAKIGGGMLIKKAGEAPLLLANPMERDEAAKSGLQLLDSTKYNYRKLLDEEGGNVLRASVRRWEMILADLGVQGNVALYGQEDQGTRRDICPGVQLSSERHPAYRRVR